MKRIFLTVIFLSLIFTGCAGTDEVKPSDDSLSSKEAIDALSAISDAYHEKNRDVLMSRIHPVIAGNIMKDLDFEKVTLSFSPLIVRIKEASTIVNADWQGTWVDDGRQIQRRGIADFVFIEEPMKLVHVHGDNPFYLHQVPDEEAGGEAPAMTPDQPEESAEKPAEDVSDERAETSTGQLPVPSAGEPKADAETPAVEPLKRSKLLYREQEIIEKERALASGDDSDERFIVQVGAWRNRKYAQTALELLKGFYPESIIVEESGFYKLRINRAMNKKDGMAASADIEEKFNLRPALMSVQAFPAHAVKTVQPVSGAPEYFVQIGAWKNEETAQSALKELRQYYPEAVIIVENNFHKVGVPVASGKQEGSIIARGIEEKLFVKPVVRSRSLQK